MKLLRRFYELLNTIIMYYCTRIHFFIVKMAEVQFNKVFIHITIIISSND